MVNTRKWPVLPGLLYFLHLSLNVIWTKTISLFRININLSKYTYFLRVRVTPIKVKNAGVNIEKQTYYFLIKKKEYRTNPNCIQRVKIAYKKCRDRKPN